MLYTPHTIFEYKQHTHKHTHTQVVAAAPPPVPSPDSIARSSINQAPPESNNLSAVGSTTSAVAAPEVAAALTAHGNDLNSSNGSDEVAAILAGVNTRGTCPTKFASFDDRILCVCFPHYKPMLITHKCARVKFGRGAREVARAIHTQHTPNAHTHTKKHVHTHTNTHV